MPLRLARGSSYLLSGSDDGTVRLWDVSSQQQLRPVARLSRPVKPARFAGGGTVEVVTRDRRLHVLDPHGKELAVRRAAPVGPPRASDGATALIRGDEVLIRRPDGRVLPLRGHRAAVTSASFARGGRLVVTTSRDRTARVWNARTGGLLDVLSGHFGTVRDAAFSPDTRWVVTAGPSTAALLDTATGQRVFSLRGHTDALTTVAFDPAGERILTGGLDGTVRIFACEICRRGDRLIDAARRRLAGDRR